MGLPNESLRATLSAFQRVRWLGAALLILPTPGEDATKAAAEDNKESPPPNDYYIRNVNPACGPCRCGPTRRSP
jgi:hypothetical protein